MQTETPITRGQPCLDFYPAHLQKVKINIRSAAHLRDVPCFLRIQDATVGGPRWTTAENNQTDPRPASDVKVTPALRPGRRPARCSTTTLEKRAQELPVGSHGWLGPSHYCKERPCDPA